MVIPDYQSCMLPLLEFTNDNPEHSLREAVEYVSVVFHLSAVERKEQIQSGAHAIIYNRVGWARTYLKKAGLGESPRRGVLKITQQGLDVLNEKPDRIDNKFLRQFSEFKDFMSRQKP